jgi:hypothetical protein
LSSLRVLVDERIAVVVDPVAELDGLGMDGSVGIVAIIQAGRVTVAVLIDVIHEPVAVVVDAIALLDLPWMYVCVRVAAVAATHGYPIPVVVELRWIEIGRADVKQIDDPILVGVVVVAVHVAGAVDHGAQLVVERHAREHAVRDRIGRGASEEHVRATWLVAAASVPRAPTITSPKPSSFTSPADATEAPNAVIDPVDSPVSVKSGVASRDGPP